MAALVVGDPHKPRVPFLLPRVQQRHHGVGVHQAVALHQVEALAPQTQLLLLQAAQGVAFIGQVLARRPQLVRNEELIVDVQSGHEIADCVLGAAVQR